MSNAAVSDEQLVKLCQACISQLSDRFVYEKGLFRTHASLTDVRSFKRQLLLDANAVGRIRSESDPHIIVGVIQSCLKDMSLCLFHEVYEDLMRLEIGDSVESVVSAITSWIINVSSPKFELIRSLFGLLVRVASLGGNEAVLQHVASTIAPCVCRPTNTHFMSIRHQSDLKRSRVVIAFMIEHVNLIFTKDLASRPTVAGNGKGKSPSTAAKKPFVPRLLDFHGTLASGSFSNSFDENNCMHTSSNGYDDVEAVQQRALFGEVDGSNSNIQNSNTTLNLQSWEWNVLETMTAARLDFFLRPRTGGNNIFHVSSSPLDLDADTKNWQRLLGQAGYGSGRPSTPATGLWTSSSSGSSNNFNSTIRKDSKASSGSGNAARLLRRKLVAEVKHLRSEIAKFEDDWMRRHNRTPRASERGAMAEVYEKYRSLKRNVRDNAAKSIQRLIRGFLARRLLQHMKFGSKRTGKLFLAPLSDSSQTLASSPAGVSLLSINSLSITASSSSTGNTGQSAHKRKISESPSPGRLNEADADDSSVHASTKMVADVFAKFRDLWGQKHELKRRLKKFDDDFSAQHNRQPSKAEKEVMRPMYDKYHEVKSSLDALKAEIEASSEPIPENLVALLGTQDKNRKSSENGGTGTSAFADDGHRDSMMSVAGDDPAVNIRPEDGQELTSLMEEKKQLHSYLKDYEREFTRTHGRPVMRQEDIQPVAQEYRRYKELKNLTAKK